MPKYISKLLLQIDGQDASANLMQDILQVSVEESLHLPGMFTLVIQNDYFPGRAEGDEPWRYDDVLTIGKAIKIGFTSSTMEAAEFSEEQTGYVLEGEITAIESHFTSEAQAPVIVRGYDVSHRLHRGRYNRSFVNQTDTDIVNAIAGEVGIQTNTVDESGGPHGYEDEPGYIFQENQTNMEFLRERASRLGFELFVQNGKLNFRNPVTDGSALILKWLQNLFSFRVRVSTAEQVQSVEVRGWDYSTKQAVVATATTESVLTSTEMGTGSETSTTFGGTPKMIVVDRPVFSQDEADTMAQGLCNELGGEFVYADAKGDGNPEIRVGKQITLEGMGKYSGSYYVTEARHLFYGNIYTTEFGVRGLRQGDLLSALAPSSRLKPGQTSLVGIVTDNNDPKKWGRVKVKFPTLTEEHNSYWARVVSAGAGANRGFDCLPEVNDEVLVAFEHGDIHRPYVVGNVWNGTDAPPEDVENSVVEGQVRLRTFKTRVGHKLQFVEEDKDDSKAGFYVETRVSDAPGHILHMNDSDKKIEIKTKDGFYVLIDDENKKIEIKTAGGSYLLLDDQNKKAELLMKSGHHLLINDTDIKMKSAGKIDLEAGGNITIDAGMNNVTITGGKIEAKGTTEVSLTTGGSNVKTSNTGVDAKGALVNVKADGMMTVEGGMTNVKANGPTTVKGNPLMLN